MSQNRVCVRCAIDSTIPGVLFDENEQCNHCKLYDEIDERFNNEERKIILNNIINDIKTNGKGKEYDCIVGVSGGQDSSYTLYMAKKFGLRPLAVHFDNGWNSEQSVRNIKNITSKLDIDLYTFVVDWEEFKDLQIAFLKASVSDAEIPTDIAIKSVLYRTAIANKVKYILYSGSNYRTEGVIPKEWTFMDGKYIKSVQKLYGTKKLRSFPNLTILNQFYYHFIKRIKVIRVLDLIAFESNNVLKILRDELGWEYYGGKHCESVYTKFFQYYILPKKFGIDKRKIHYSALIRSKQVNRDEIIQKLKELPYSNENINVDITYVCKKFGLSREDFNSLLALPIKSYKDYPTYYPIIQFFRPIINILKKIGIWPKIA